jgi:phenylpropionate dioxygenase-like ring-hydroxylating dioxygenase large terminal subunit
VEFLGPLAEQLEQLPVARATTFTEYVYDVEANWKVTYDNFQENYHLRFIHDRSGATGTSKDNPFGYPTDYRFYGPHRAKSLFFNWEADIAPVQGLALMKGGQFAAEAGYGDSALNKEYFALFPNMFLLGTAQSHFSHAIIPVGPTRSRGVIRLYWIGADDSASKRFAREYALAAIRDIHCEDRAIVEASQQGLLSGALEHIHFQTNEVLCRHLFHVVNEMVETYKAETCKAERGAHGGV